MEHEFLSEVIFEISVVLSSVSQVLLKKSSAKSYRSRGREYLNPYTLCAYGLFFLSSIMTAVAYKYVPLSKGQILEAGGYVYVSGFSVIFLKEHLKKQEILGILCIMAGIIIYAG